MISTTCACGAAFNIPGSFLNEPLECEHCKARLVLVAREGHAEEVTGRIQFTSGKKQRGDQFLLAGDGPLNLGRLPDNEIVLDGDQLSRLHCTLCRSDFGWIIQDNNSRNGVFVNGKRVTNHDLNNGDVIDLGDVRFIFADLAPQFVPPAIAKPPEPVAVPVAAVAVEEEILSADVLEEIPDDLANIPIAKAYVPENVDFLDLAPDAPPPPRPAPKKVEIPMDGPICPSCKKQLQRGAKICVACGINVDSGRAIITAKGFDENQMAEHCRNFIPLVSWIAWFGLYPVASEAYGFRKPYTVWSTAIITAIISVIFYACINGEGGWDKYKNGMLWIGDPNKSRLDEVMARVNREIDREVQKAQSRGRLVDPERVDRYRNQIRKNILEEYPEITKPGQLRWYQTITCMFLHDTSGRYRFLMHISGNTLFLIVLGVGVNSLIGNMKMGIIYPLLGIAASIAELIAYSHDALGPALGASGAIMGIAGMYLVLFPVNKVYMAIWIRPVFGCFYKVWPMRGFWVVLFFIMFDVIATLEGSRDGVAHWAHLGGFIAGMVVAVLLLVTRLVDARGGDAISMILGRKAWALLGKPSDRTAVA